MTDTRAIMSDLALLGISLKFHSDNLRLDAPAGLVTLDLVELIRANKPALLALLRPTPLNASNPPEAHGRNTNAPTGSGGLPPYKVGDDPLAATTPREAAVNSLILAHAFRVAVEEWHDLAGPDVFPDANVLRCVKRDIDAALAVLGDARGTDSRQLQIGEEESRNDTLT